MGLQTTWTSAQANYFRKNQKNQRIGKNLEVVPKTKSHIWSRKNVSVIFTVLPTMMKRRASEVLKSCKWSQETFENLDRIELKVNSLKPRIITRWKFGFIVQLFRHFFCWKIPSISCLNNDLIIHKKKKWKENRHKLWSWM